MTTNETTAGTQEHAGPGMPSPVRTLLIAGFALIVICGGVLMMDSKNAPPPMRLDAPSTLPVIAQAPEFSLTERSGNTITRGDLLGSVWVVDFIFTRCAGPCPKLNAKFRSMQRDLDGRDGVKLVSICLDPTNDTPAALATYAKRFSADPDKWWFLTGKREKDVHELVGKGFLQSVVPASGDEPLMHSTYMMVIDSEGRIRSAYNGLDAGARDRIMADIDALLAEKRG